MLNTVGETVQKTSSIMSLWKHECYRVIADRFTTPEDKEWFEKTICKTAEEECGTALTAEMQEEPYFVDFLRDAPEPTGTNLNIWNIEVIKLCKLGLLVDFVEIILV